MTQSSRIGRLSPSGVCNPNKARYEVIGIESVFAIEDDIHKDEIPA
jgi:hypothetical protein